jgi:hypothetical protein
MSDEATQDARAVLLESLWGDEEIRPALQDLIAKKHPKTAATMPEVGVRRAIDAARTELQSEREKFRLEREQERNVAEVRRRREEIVSGFTARDGSRVKIAPADVEAVEKLMIDEGIGSHRAAAELYAAQTRVAAPTPSTGRNMEIPGRRGAGGDEYAWLKPGIEGDRSALDRVARDEAERVWDTLKRGGAEAESLLTRYGG